MKMMKACDELVAKWHGTRSAKFLHASMALPILGRRSFFLAGVCTLRFTDRSRAAELGLGLLEHGRGVSTAACAP